MSIFSNQQSWPAGCSSGNQSPINLSQSGAKPCHLSCDLVMDDGHVTQGGVSVSDEGLLFMHNSGLGSCKFRGESYVCDVIAVNHPSHHTIEGVQADGEVIAHFRKPTGEMLCVSSLFRVNPAQTPSYTFFKQFVPYATTAGEPTKVTLQNWSLSMMVPPNSAYYTYQGSTLSPPCTPTEWIVFKSMINIDTGDFAYLVRNVEAGSRSVQALGQREVFFNNTENMPGAMPNDNKFYLRLGAPLKKNRKHHVKDVDLKTTAAKEAAAAKDDEKNPKTTGGKAWKATKDQVDKNGGILGTIEFLILILLCVGAAWLGYKYGWSTNSYKPSFAKNIAVWIRGTVDWFFKKKEVVYVPGQGTSV